MKIRIGIWGSCVTQDIFRSVFNDYEEYFEIVSSLERVSLISLMDNEQNIEFNDEDIQIYPLNDKNKFKSNRLSNELSKDYLKIIGNNIDYLIIDEFFEVYFGVIKIDNTFITNNFLDLPDTKFYEKIRDNEKLTFCDDFIEYYALWKTCCDEFFDYFHKYFPHVKIILNKVKLSSKVLKNDGSYYIDQNFKREMENYNPLIRILENYLENNHDVLIVDCTKYAVLNENHVGGKGFLNYCDDFYVNAFERILDIINENSLTNKDEDFINSNVITSDYNLNRNDENDKMIKSSLNSKIEEYLDIKKYLFEEASVENNFIDLTRLKDYLKYISKNNYKNPTVEIQQASFNELIKINRFIVENKEHLDEETKYIENEINSQYFNENSEFLIKYLESRIDIKNYGDETNKIIILNSNDSSLNITQPSWFENKDGIGSVIRSVKGDLDLSFKCVNDGKLVIEFKSIDFRDKNNHRIPIYIDYTELRVNDKVIANESRVSWHDSPITFEKDVKDGEKINIKLKWNPLNYKSNIFLDSDYEKLINNFYEARFDVKNVGNNDNDLILIDCDDSSSHVSKPAWFKDNRGVGTVISSTAENINMSFKCLNDGILEIYFRAMDLTYENNRIPIFIDYTKIKVNETDIIGENTSTWHDDPFVYKQEVKDNQIINIHAEWKPLSAESNLSLLQYDNNLNNNDNYQNNIINSKESEIKRLKKELEELINENNELSN